MGTRNMTFVWRNGKYDVAQYCQWDGYPEGQGCTTLRFVRDEMDREKFLAALDKCTDYDPEVVKERYQELADQMSIKFNPNDGLISHDLSKAFGRKWPQLHRDMGAEVLKAIQDAGGLELQRYEIEFAADSLFCEWAYVIDFDKNTLEAYKGFNLEPLDPSERFASLPLREVAKDWNGCEETQYYPVKLVHSWPLDGLPTDEEFCETLRPTDDEDEEVEAGAIDDAA